ncbi:MAG: ATP-binding cassette domain-containing protein, partial [Candidatus Hydrogenedentes bacterium]|nr:ATP-binding cassette domain-containing protein [Candidatus Hydrogenedentota bacterium]
AIAPENGCVALLDLDTTNGTYVNGTKVKRQILEEGDCIGLGRPAPHHFIFTRTTRSSRRQYLLPLQSIYRVGRSSNCDLPLIHDPTVSAEHARLRMQSGKLLLEDLGSGNGTFVNGRLIRYAELHPDDLVRIGSFEIRFQQSQRGLRVFAEERRNRVQIEAQNLVRLHKNHPILRGINLVVNPGEYVGVLGPSGAGKSTLLNALNGFQPANSGQVLLNGVSLYRTYDMFRNTIGYVPQDDIIHRELTVERSLMYTAQLRLPRDTSAEQIGEQVTSVIETLGLSHVRHNPVANLSGGQRKRVSIGCELLTRPSLIFLDEPTSGLDPSTEEKLMRHFRQMSEQGQTVILTTHILYNLDLLDMIVLLSRGRLVYFGPTAEVCPFFNSPEHPIARPIDIFDLLEPESPDSSLREERAEHYEKKYIESPLFTEFVEGRGAGPPLRENAVELASAARNGRAQTRRLRGLLRRIFDIGQLGILTRRNLDQKMSFPSRLGVPLLTPIVLALLTATTDLGDQAQLDNQRVQFEQNNPKFLSMLEQPGMPMNREEFMEMRFEGFGGLAVPLSLPLTMVMTAVFLGTLSACLEISGERSIYLRERAVNLSIPTYVASKLSALFMLSAVQCFVYVFLTMVILQPQGVSILSLVFICVGVSWVSCLIGLFISSLDPSAGQSSVILAVIAVLPQMIFSGAMAPAFYGGMTDVVKIIAAFLPARWGFELMLTAFYQQTDWARNLISGGNPPGMGFRFGEDVYVRNAIMLGLLALGYFTATCVSLKRYDKL